MTALPPASGASASELLETASRLFRASLLKCLPLGMVAVLCAQLANYYWRATGHPLNLTKPPDDPTYGVLAILGLVGYMWLLSAMMLRQRALIGGVAHVSAELAMAARRLPFMMATWLLGALALAIGFAPAWIAARFLSGAARMLVVMLLAVPSLYLLVCFTLLMPIALFDRYSPYRAVVRAIELVRPVWIKVCAAIVIAFLIALVCAFAAVLCITLLENLGGNSPVSEALANALALAVQAVLAVFFSALGLVLYSMASNSA